MRVISPVVLPPVRIFIVADHLVLVVLLQRRLNVQRLEGGQPPARPETRANFAGVAVRCVSVVVPVQVLGRQGVVLPQAHVPSERLAVIGHRELPAVLCKEITNK